MRKKNVICLMGPTASGKTDVAMRLYAALDVEIISVDSALVYRGMDIGTAKPDEATLQEVPHHLIDIRDVTEPYSAGDFVHDATQLIDDIHARGKYPLLVGGTMLYHHALQCPMADLPEASLEIREALEQEADNVGWAAMHDKLKHIDPVTAFRLKPSDKQRIQRALEVFEISGKPLSTWHKEQSKASPYTFCNIALAPEDRGLLHQRIETRLHQMFDAGFVDEVRHFYNRQDVHAELPAMRSVGYRQVWSHLDGEIDLCEAKEKALFATRQLAKRQLTWLRNWSSGIQWCDTTKVKLFEGILSIIQLAVD